MTLNDRVSREAARLTAADRRLLQVLLSHPQEASYLPATEVAARAGVHQASATKFAQKLGYTGYPELRRDLQQDLLISASDRIALTVDQAGEDGLLAAVVEQEMGPLVDLPRQVSQAQLDRVATLLLTARSRFVFGRGNAVVLADLLDRRMRRFGMPTIPLTGSGRDLAEQLVALGREDVVVLYAFRREPRYFSQVLDLCVETGARAVLITDTLAAEAAARPAETLVGSRGAAREFQSLTVPMAITNALVLTVARTAPQRSRAGLTRLEQLLDRFDHPAHPDRPQR